MKKIYLLAFSFIALSAMESKAQTLDTLVYESFNYQYFYDDLVDDVAPPPGVSSDILWYSYDQDQKDDGSGAGFSGGWQALFPFSDVDTTDLDMDGANDNTVLGANSWFTPFGVASNWLITPSYVIRAGDMLYWKSAPRQTPRYMDGYKVKISTTTNDDNAFTTTLFSGAEMTALGADTNYATYTFSSGFVHGQDGTYIDVVEDPNAATIAHRGQLRPFSVDLSPYVGQEVFFAFHHNSNDDYLISIDDFMIRRTVTGVESSSVSNELSLNVFPNPSVDVAQVNYNLPSSSNVTITVYDVTGKVISVENKGNQSAGRNFTMINTSVLANGFYTVTVQTDATRISAKMIVK
ncbi:MAG: hypothetical protein K0Q95_1129 [Bacteroidota bacterium]|jgi:hypothetical protein|nr:hypothetical protein [Bacteroidota bacterium]